MKKIIISIFLFALTLTFPDTATAQTSWPMLGANPQRTSWTPDEAPGQLNVTWVKPFEPKVPLTTQPIAAESKIFVPTSRGLYAFDATTGDQVWVFATELPIGNAPTYDNGFLYVGGLDRNLYKINASDGQPAWSFTADSGFMTNPVVVNNAVYLGSRGGRFYAINASTGNQTWQTSIGSQILQSAAYSSANGGRLFFGAMDGYAYALNAANGNIEWQRKLPGMGWNNLWPVVYKDQVIFTRTEYSRNTGSNFAHEIDYLGETEMLRAQQQYLFPTPQNQAFEDYSAAKVGAEPGFWPPGTPTVDFSINPFKAGNSVINFLETYRDTRNLFFLRQSDGVETTFDLDNDGAPDAAPFLRTIEDNKTTYPPMIRGCAGCDEYIYARNPIFQSGTFSSSMAVGWKYNTKFATLPISPQAGMSPAWEEDEYVGISGGGNYIHYSKAQGTHTGGANLAAANTTYTDFLPNYPNVAPANFPQANTSRQWRYTLDDDSYPPGTKNEAIKYYWQPLDQAYKKLFFEHTMAAPIVYQGKVYSLTGNTLVAFTPSGPSTLKPKAANPAPAPQTASTLPAAELQTRLATEVAKIVAKDGNGNYVHLKPGYAHAGRVDTYMDATHVYSFGDNLFDYWSNPAEMFTILIAALPHLNPSLQTEVKNYLQNEYKNLDVGPAKYAYIGWKDGVFRETFDWPAAMIPNLQPLVKKTSTSFNYWSFPPQNIYAVWKYVQAGLCESPCTASTELSTVSNKLSATFPYNNQLTYLSNSMPHVLNAYIAGYHGFVELAKLTNNGVLPPAYQGYKTTLDSLKAVRKDQFTTVLTAGFGTCPGCEEANRYFFYLHSAYNFLYMTPELGDYLHDNTLTAVQQAFDIYTNKAASPPSGTNDGPRTPNWMQAHNNETQGETGISPYQQTYALFQAKALVLQDSQAELSKYIDAPIMKGDLYYIDNLVATLNASSTNPSPPPNPTPTPANLPGDTDNDNDVDIFDYSAVLSQFGQTGPPAGGLSGDVDPYPNGDNDVDIFDFNLVVSNFST